MNIINNKYLSNTHLRRYGAITISFIASLLFFGIIIVYLLTYGMGQNFLNIICINYKFLCSPILMFFVLVFPLHKIFNKYIPDEICCHNKKEICEFMRTFIDKATSRITIVTNSFNWINDPSANIVKKMLFTKSSYGIEIVIIASEMKNSLENELIHHDIKIYKRNFIPKARFTLINSSKINSAQLAIAKGVLPEHIISVYTYNENPYIIELSLDMINQTIG